MLSSRSLSLLLLWGVDETMCKERRPTASKTFILQILTIGKVGKVNMCVDQLRGLVKSYSQRDLDVGSGTGELPGWSRR